MKKALLLFASAALLFAGCAKEQIAGNAGEGEQTVSFTVGVASDATKAVADNDGAAANINHWIMQVLDSDGEVYNYQEKDATAGQLTQTFSVPLIKGQIYQVLFWADTKGNYVVTDLRNITRATELSLTANRDDLDAFSAAVNDFTTTVATQQNITLTRPFAQLNVVFTDLKKLYETMGSDAEYTKFKPVDFVAKAKVPTTFNVLTQEAGAPAETALEMTAATNYLDNYADHAEKATLYMDYILTSKDNKDVVDIDFSFTSKGVEITHNFTAIPFQRNYRTNIIGEFMSAGAQWNVVVDPQWAGEYDKEYESEGSVAAAIEALKAGKTAVEIITPEDYDTPVALPAQTDGKDISIKVTGVTGREMTFNLAGGAQGPANLYITSDAQDLTINCPNSHVEVNGGTYQSVEATTSATTLVVGKDVTIDALTIKKGNVEIHGKVANLIRANNSVKAAMYASDRATLVNYINWAKPNETVYLECDINLAGENWTPIMAGTIEATATIDGCNHAIKNMIVKGGDAGAGFLYCNSGIVKNLTIDNATVEGATEDKGNMYGIVAGYAYGNATFENITVKNSKIHAFGKVSAILGMAADGNGTTIVKNCKVENTEIIGCYNVANYVGLLQNAIVLEGCTSTNVTKSIGGRYGEEAYVTFDNVKVINNSDPANPKYVLSSGKYWKYVSGSNIYYYSAFADCYNDIHYDGWKALDGTVDGLVFNTPETPQPIDLEPVATIGTTKYYDLPSAFAAVQAGETLNIWQAGEYTLPASLPNITVSGNVNDIVFNCVGSGSIASISNGATFKDVTMNFGQSNYHGFQHAGHIIMEGCTLNGLFFSYGDMTFKGCTFNQENEEYNMWCYGKDLTYDGCTFNSKGKFLNVYCENNTEAYNIVAKDCVFNTSKVNKAALNIKETCGANFLKYNVTITNCSCNELQNTLENKQTSTLYRVSPIWQVDDIKEGETGINVTVDGLKVYPFCSKDSEGNYHIVNADGLLQFHDLYNAAKVAKTAKVYLENDIDFTGKTWTACDWFADSNKKGFALLDGQNHTIKNFAVSGQGMFSRWAGGATPHFKDIVFDGAKNVTSTLNVSLFCGQVYQDAKIENVIIKNSQFEGTYKVAPFVGTVYDERPGNTVTLTLKDCKVENTTVRGTSYDFDICGMVAWVNELGDNDKIAFEGNNVVKDVTLYTPGVSYSMCAKIYHNGSVAYDEATNVTVTNVNVVNGQ